MRHATFQVRPARPADVDIVLAFIGKKAAFDRAVGASDGVVRATAAGLGKAMFGEPAHARALLLEDDEVVGFAFYYFRFSSFSGRPSLWLDDLYVDAARRRAGAGAALMRQLAIAALDADCTHLAWTADDRNGEGMSFYRKLGAEIADQRGHQVTWRIAPEALRAATASTAS
jgi:GNAT superfamily N-acetyltransferase